MQEWCCANGAECLAVQAPGRLLRGREPPITRAADLAAALLPVVASRLSDGVPYVVRTLPHACSQGEWVVGGVHSDQAMLPFIRAALLAAAPLPLVASHLCGAVLCVSQLHVRRNLKVCAEAVDRQHGIRPAAPGPASPCPCREWRDRVCHPAGLQASFRCILRSPNPSCGGASLGVGARQVIGHSVGTWLAYEFLAAARAAGLPEPRAAFLSAMPAPDLPPARRPWRAQRGLSEVEFMVCSPWVRVQKRMCALQRLMSAPCKREACGRSQCLRPDQLSFLVSAGLPPVERQGPWHTQCGGLEGCSSWCA